MANGAEACKRFLNCDAFYTSYVGASSEGQEIVACENEACEMLLGADAPSETGAGRRRNQSLKLGSDPRSSIAL
mgnify:CR=1 FL=1